MQTAQATFGIKSLAVGIAALATIAAIGLYAFQLQAASEAVLVRGIVKPGGANDSVNLYITHVTTSADASKIRGTRVDVDVSQAKKYKWQVASGVLSKVRTTSNPTPEQEVVVKGTRLDDGRIKASWMVQNYRQFTILGVLQERTLDTNKTDSGYVTVNVTSSSLRGVSPTHPFKQAALKGKDLMIRVDGQTDVTALGKSKSFEEVTAGQQQVRIEGQMLNEDSWGASKLMEIN